MHVRVHPFLLVPVALLLALALAGCKKQAAPPPPATNAAVGDDEAQQFATAFEKAVRSGDARAIDARIDWPFLLEQATTDVEAPMEVRLAFLRGAGQQPGAEQFGRDLAADVAQGGRYKLLRVRAQGDQRRALFRWLQSKGPVEYHEVVLARRPGGAVRAVDVFNYQRGEPASQTFRRAYLLLVAARAPAALDKLGAAEREYVKSLRWIKLLLDGSKSGSPDLVLRAYARLPGVLQKDRMFLLLRLQAAAEGQDEEHLAAVEALREHYPGDPAADLWSIDYHMGTERFDLALEALGRLDRAVGGDPYLDVRRAKAHRAAGRLDEARQAAQKAVEAEPGLPDGYWALVEVSLKEARFDETLRLLEVLVAKFQAPRRDLTGLPDYAEFVKSPQYQRWLAGPKGKG
jgi:tetratricopeptide (TPR) repeat protein